VRAPQELPRSLDPAAWRDLDEWARHDTHWEQSRPSTFARWTDPLVAYAASIPAARDRSRDPLTTVRDVIERVHRDFEYAPTSTRVDSPIDDALKARRGVCQDFAHIAVAILRRIGVPARYVSGYIAPGSSGSADAGSPSATHAWIEVLLPKVGWRGFDPTHNEEAGMRHIRVAVGRDYADVPPARGVYKGTASSVLKVGIDVRVIDAEATLRMPIPIPTVSAASAARVTTESPRAGRTLQQEQQQQ
jgi:transglutaminase-like putative cysteine protease